MRPLEGIPERDRVYSNLLEQIATNELQPGTRLIEAQVALRLGVSRTPVREALLRLEREGLVTGQRHRGFKVSAPDERTARETFPIVGALQGLALVETGPILHSLAGALEQANLQLREAKTPADAIAADSEFHRILISVCSNMRLITLIQTLHHQLLRYEHIYMADGSLIEMSFAQHQAIIDAIKLDDIPAAERAVRANYASGLAIVISKLRK